LETSGDELEDSEV